jgi:hypothetical protein
MDTLKRVYHWFRYRNYPISLHPYPPRISPVHEVIYHMMTSSFLHSTKRRMIYILAVNSCSTLSPSISIASIVKIPYHGVQVLQSSHIFQHIYGLNHARRHKLFCKILVMSTLETHRHQGSVYDSFSSPHLIFTPSPNSHLFLSLEL